MAIENLTTPSADDNRVNDLYRAIAILDGLEAYAHQNEDGSGHCTTLLHMSTAAREAIMDVAASMNP